MSTARKAALYRSLLENNLFRSKSGKRKIDCSNVCKNMGFSRSKKLNKGVNVKKKDVQRMSDRRLSA